MSRTFHNGRGANAPGASPVPRRFLYAAITCCLLTATLAALILYGEYQEQRQYWHEKVARVADINQRLLENWVRERNEDAQLQAAFPSTEKVLSGREGEPTRPQTSQQALHNQLDSVAHTYSYAGAYILDSTGRVAAQSNGSPAIAEAVRRESAAALRQRTLTIPSPGIHTGYPQIAFIAPIRQSQPSGAGATTGSVIGHALLLTRAEGFGSLLLADMGATATGETVFLQLQSGKAVFISPLRHWKEKDGSLPVTPPGSLGQISLLQRRDLFSTYRDYRGVPVLAAARFLPALDWAMVTKVDRKESLAAFQQTAIFGISLALLVVLTLLSLATAWLRHQRVQRLQSDVARGKQIEENLRRSEERFWVALDNSPVVVFNQDRELRYTWVNKPVPPWSEVGFLGMTDEEIIGLEDGSQLSALKRPVLESGVGARKEWSFLYRGERRDYDINIQPLRNSAGEVVGITCASTDITERKRAEEHLREYEKVVEGLDEMIVVIDWNYRYLIANRAFLNHRGLHREQIIGRPAHGAANSKGQDGAGDPQAV